MYCSKSHEYSTSIDINNNYYVYFLCINSLTGNYSGSLSDAKAAIELQPTYFKAIVRGNRGNYEFFPAQDVTSHCPDRTIITVYGKRDY